MLSKYYLILFWCGLFAFFALEFRSQFYRRENVLGVVRERMRPIPAFLLFLPLIIWSGWRGYIVDTGAYIGAFQEMPETLSDVFEYINHIPKDRGFYLFSAVIKCLITTDYHIYFVILALLQSAAIILVWRKYSTSISISFFLLIASTDYMSWYFNGIRQFMAVIIVFAATTLMLKKRYLPLLIVILIASTFHQSALLMIPVVLMCQGQAWNKKTMLCLAAILVAVAFVDQFTDILDTAMQETQYANMVTDWTEGQDDGTNPFRVAVYALPTLLSLLGIRYVRAANDPVINLSVNMSIFSTGFYLLSMVTSGIFIGRLPIYMSLYNYILLPWLIDRMFEKRSAQFVKICMVGGYLLFYYYQMHIAWGYM